MYVSFYTIDISTLPSGKIILKVASCHDFIVIEWKLAKKKKKMQMFSILIHLTELNIPLSLFHNFM